MAVIFEDTFTDSDSTVIASHTPTVTGTSWARAGDATMLARILTNDLWMTRGSTNDFLFCIATGATTPDDQTVEATMYFDAATTSMVSGVVCRYTDTSNYVMLRHNAFEGDNLELAKCVSGAETTVRTAYTFSAYTSYALKIVASGSDLTAYVAGSQITALNTTTTLTGGKGGVASLQSVAQNIVFTDFKHTDDDTGGSAIAAISSGYSIRSITR